MPQAPLKTRKRLWKYVQAGRAFDDAATVALQLLAVEQVADNPIEPPLWTALVVSYGRPFTHNEGVGPIDIALVPEKDRKLHSMLIAFRNKISGHIDHTMQFDAGNPMNTASLLWKDGKLRASTSVARPHKSVIPQIGELCVTMRRECEKIWQGIYIEIAKGETFFDGKKTINLGEDSDELFIP